MVNLAPLKMSAIEEKLSTRDRFKLGHNTYAHYREGKIAITYHDNFIAGWFAGEDRLILSCAGWHTSTTADRLNQISHANGGGWVSRAGGTMTYRNRSTQTVHDMDPWVEIDTSTGKVVDTAHDSTYYGWTNEETHTVVEGLDNIEWLYRASRSVSSPGELRELVKQSKRDIGYNRIGDVNVREIFAAIKNERV